MHDIQVYLNASHPALAGEFEEVTISEGDIPGRKEMMGGFALLRNHMEPLA
jgi:hypothetical protein